MMQPNVDDDANVQGQQKSSIRVGVEYTESARFMGREAAVRTTGGIEIATSLPPDKVEKKSSCRIS